jgi:hypothetical protein
MANPGSWSCPNCNRRVPSYSSTCHCGARRADAERARIAARRQPARGRLRHELPRSFWVLTGVVGLVLVALVALLFVPLEPPPRVPCLGYGDRHPTPTPKR